MVREEPVVTSGQLKSEKPKVLETIKIEKKDLAYYMDAFTHLHTAVVKGKKAPHKALLLLSVMDLVEEKTIKSNQIELTDELVKRFMSNTLTLAKGYSGKSLQIGMPYVHMKSEPFWMLVEESEYSKLFSNNYSVMGVRMMYKHAVLDDELFAYMKDGSARKQLRELLLSEYLGQTLEGIQIPEGSDLILKKLVDKSVLYQGFTIPVAEHEKFYAHLQKPLKHGEQCKIKVWMDGQEYTCSLINQAFNQSLFADHKDVLQVRWNESDPICQHIQKVFERSKQFIDSARATREVGMKTVIRVPKAMQQFIEVYGTEKKLEFRFKGVR